MRVSGKTAWGFRSSCRRCIERVPPPQGDPEGPLQAMVFDSHYDDYRGAIIYSGIMSGRVRKGQKCGCSSGFDP